MEPGRIVHTIDPVFSPECKVLMLGTMPSPKSREQGFYYGHPQNRFWKVMAAVLREALPETKGEKRSMLLRHGIALWDVLASCDIEGASDASIKNPVPNDIGRLLREHPIEAVFCTGAKAAQLYTRLVEPETGKPCVKLPSTSPANAQMGTDELVRIYSEALRPWVG